MNYDKDKYKDEKDFFFKFLFPVLNKIKHDIELTELMHQSVPSFIYFGIKVELLIGHNVFSLFCNKHSVSHDIKYSELETENGVQKIKNFFNELEEENEKYLIRFDKVEKLLKKLNTKGNSFEFTKEFREVNHRTISCNGVIFIKIHFSYKRIIEVSFQTMYPKKGIDLKDMTMSMIRSLNSVDEIISLFNSFD